MVAWGREEDREGREGGRQGREGGREGGRKTGEGGKEGGRQGREGGRERRKRGSVLNPVFYHPPPCPGPAPHSTPIPPALTLSFTAWVKAM